MNFLRAIEFNDSTPCPDGFPFDLRVVESTARIEFETPVTFFVGENGSGKSTIVETIACGMKMPAIGSAEVSRDPTLAHAKSLARHYRFEKSRPAKQRFFFRAEDAFGFTRRVRDDLDELRTLAEHFDRTLKGYGRQLAMGAAMGQRKALTERYGENPDAHSHGELFLNLLHARLRPRGLYLLDEPETPLSPIHQLTLLSIIKEMVGEECQFIVATHSPILMAYPGATILSFDSTPVSAIAWEEVEHVEITRAFLNNPESFLRRL